MSIEEIKALAEAVNEYGQYNPNGSIIASDAARLAMAVLVMEKALRFYASKEHWMELMLEAKEGNLMFREGTLVPAAHADEGANAIEAIKQAGEV